VLDLNRVPPQQTSLLVAAALLAEHPSYAAIAHPPMNYLLIHALAGQPLAAEQEERQRRVGSDANAGVSVPLGNRGPTPLCPSPCSMCTRHPITHLSMLDACLQGGKTVPVDLNARAIS
jgi:hypothetical protein